MIQPEVQEVASVFRGELHWMFSPYPALIPEGGWPSIGILDALCSPLRERSDWLPGERLFVSGAAAHLGEIVGECWSEFASDVRVEHHDGIVCSADLERGSRYELPLERVLVTALRDPGSLELPDEHLPFLPSSQRNVVELLGLSACLGISPLGKGDGAFVGPARLRARVEAVLPHLAASCARYYGRRFAEESLGQKPDLYHRLLWPLSLCDGPLAIEEAGGNLLAFIDGSLSRAGEALPLLSNLARFPARSARDAAIVCLALNERTRVAADLVEIASDHIGGRAAAFRAASIALAADRGSNIDWLAGAPNAEARFRFEQRLSLIPLVHLPFEVCIDPANRALLEALLGLEVDVAASIIRQRLGRGEPDPRMLFQLAMLEHERGRADAADALLREIVRSHSEVVDAHFYVNAAVVALAGGNPDDALARLQRASKLGARGRRVGFPLTQALVRSGRLEQALTALTELGARDRLPAGLLVHRAEVQRELGRQEGYHRDLAAAAEAHPFHPGVVQQVLRGFVNA